MNDITLTVYLATFIALLICTYLSLGVARKHTMMMVSFQSSLKKSHRKQKLRDVIQLRKNASAKVTKRPYVLYFVVAVAATNLGLTICILTARELLRLEYVAIGLLMVLAFGGVLLPVVMTTGTLYLNFLEYRSVRQYTLANINSDQHMKKSGAIIRASSDKFLQILTGVWLFILIVITAAATIFVVSTASTLR